MTVSQLHKLGVTWNRLRRWLEAGWLLRVHRGVYAIHEPRSWHARWLAAVLACGERAALSHQSAAALWRIRRPREGLVEVTVAGGGGRARRPGIAVHRSPTLMPRDLRTRDGIVVTAPARTLIDLAAGVTRRELERAIDEAERRRVCSTEDLEREVRRRPRPGCAEVRALLRAHAVGSTLTRSELEERFLALCRNLGLPQPQVNARLMRLTVDFLWPQFGVVVEVDGRATHDTRRAFQGDRDRDSMLAASGYRVIRFTWWDITRRPAVVADRVKRTLRTARAPGN